MIVSATENKDKEGGASGTDAMETEQEYSNNNNNTVIINYY